MHFVQIDNVEHIIIICIEKALPSMQKLVALRAKNMFIMQNFYT